MKRRAALAVALAGCAVTAAPVRVAGAAELKPWTGAPLPPPIELRNLDGEPATLAALDGKVVLVNFWATWCEPCVEELPSMAALQERLRTMPFEILAVNYMEGEPRIRAFLQRVPVRFAILRDTDGAVARAWGARVFPSSHLIDLRGRRRFQATGSLDWAGAPAERVVRGLLAEPVRTSDAR